MNSKVDTFAQLFKTIEQRDSYWEEKAILDFTIALHQLMKRRGMSRKDFADKLGTSSAYVTRVMRGDANFTISSMVKLARALDGKVTIHVTPAEEGSATWFRALQGNGGCKSRIWANSISEETFNAEESQTVAAG